MTVTFLDDTLGNLKTNKIKNNSFFIELDMQEMNERGQIVFSQRGYITEVDMPEPSKPIKVFIPLVDSKYRQVFEESLDTEDEISFCQNLCNL